MHRGLLLTAHRAEVVERELQGRLDQPRDLQPPVGESAVLEPDVIVVAGLGVFFGGWIAVDAEVGGDLRLGVIRDRA